MLHVFFQVFPTSEDSNGLCQKGKKKALRAEYIKQDIKRNNFSLLCLPLLSLLLQPLNASSLETTAALAASWSTPNL